MLKLIVYFVDAFRVTETFLFSFTATVLDKIDMSDASRSNNRFECLNTVSNFSRLLVLNVDIVVSARALISEAVLVVRVELYFTVVVSTS